MMMTKNHVKPEKIKIHGMAISCRPHAKLWQLEAQFETKKPMNIAKITKLGITNGTMKVFSTLMVMKSVTGVLTPNLHKNQKDTILSEEAECTSKENIGTFR
jgi:hypothetical protein